LNSKETKNLLKDRVCKDCIMFFNKPILSCKDGLFCTAENNTCKNWVYDYIVINTTNDDIYSDHGYVFIPGETYSLREIMEENDAEKIMKSEELKMLINNGEIKLTPVYKIKKDL